MMLRLGYCSITALFSETFDIYSFWLVYFSNFRQFWLSTSNHLFLWDFNLTWFSYSIFCPMVGLAIRMVWICSMTKASEINVLVLNKIISFYLNSFFPLLKVNGSDLLLNKSHMCSCEVIKTILGMFLRNILQTNKKYVGILL